MNDVIEAQVHSFIIRLWLEEAAQGDEPALWRGHITHIPTNQRRYIQTLTQVTQFIGEHLAQTSSTQRSS